MHFETSKSNYLVESLSDPIIVVYHLPLSSTLLFNPRLWEKGLGLGFAGTNVTMPVTFWTKIMTAYSSNNRKVTLIEDQCF